MKYNLKPKELEDIKSFLASNPIAQLLREFSNWSFEVGDVLVKYKILSASQTKNIENVSQACPIPKKYRIVHIDDLGIPWVKQISVRGGLGNKLYCILNYSQPNTVWEIDPEQIEALLLGYKYDPRAEYKRMRTEDPSYGGKKTN